MMTIREVQSKNDLKLFASFPNQLYKSSPYYIPSFISDTSILNRSRNNALEYCECRLFLCVDGEKVLGRMATIINHRYNQEHEVKELRIYKLDTIDNFEVVATLINQAKSVAVENGLTTVVGEMGFTQFHHYGFLLDGYDNYACYNSKFNYPYVISHLKRLEFKLDHTWNSYRITLPDKLNPRLDEVTQVILKKYNLKLEAINYVKKNESLPMIINKSIALRLKNYDHFYSFNTISEEEMNNLVTMFKTIIQFTNISSCYYFVVKDKDDDVVGFILGIPSLAKMLGRQKIIISPMIASMYNKAYNKCDSIDIIGFVVNREYQNVGVAGILKNELYKLCIKNGVKYINTDFDFDLSKSIKDEFCDDKIEKLKTFGSYKYDLI